MKLSKSKFGMLGFAMSLAMLLGSSERSFGGVDQEINTDPLPLGRPNDPVDQKAYYELSNGEIFRFLLNTIETRIASSAVMGYPLSIDEEWGRSSGKPIDLTSANPKYFKKHVVPLILRGEVALSDKGEVFNLKKELDYLDITVKTIEKPGITILQLVTEKLDATPTANISCPENYVGIAANAEYGTSAFCVMKYDASEVVAENGNRKAVSAIALPSVSRTRAEAERACQENGQGYDLMSNDQYMVVSRKIEATSSNWSGGQVGSGHLSRGNSDSHSALAPSADDSQGYFGLPGNQMNDGIHKRTFALSTGENTEAIVWDWAGNVWKWVKGELRTDRHEWQEYTNATYFSANDPNRNLFAPSGRLYNSSQNMGKIFMWDAGAALRGGCWFNGAHAGVFAADLYYSASYRRTNVGFRCAFTP